MNFAAIGAQTVKPLLWVFSLSLWLDVIGLTPMGREEVTWTACEAPPPKQAFQRSGGLTFGGGRSGLIPAQAQWVFLEGTTWVSSTSWTSYMSREVASL